MSNLETLRRRSNRSASAVLKGCLLPVRIAAYAIRLTAFAVLSTLEPVVRIVLSILALARLRDVRSLSICAPRAALSIRPDAAPFGRPRGALCALRPFGSRYRALAVHHERVESNGALMGVRVPNADCGSQWGAVFCVHTALDGGVMVCNRNRASTFET